jgi:hypothetical protein
MTLEPSSDNAPTVALPAGAVAADIWDSTDPPQRVISFGCRGINGTTAEYGIELNDDEPAAVYTAAIQYADGSVYLGEDRVQQPSIHVDTAPSCALTTDEARRLAALLVEAADKIDALRPAR